MLNRSSSPQYVSLPADRLQTAMLFGMLGSFLGVLVVAAAFWLYQLNERIQEQSDSLKALAHSIDQVAGSQRLAIDTLLDKAGTENPAQFSADRYERAAKARDDARRQARGPADHQRDSRRADKETRAVAAKLETDLESANKTLSQYETDAKQAPELRERITELEKKQEELQRELEEKTEIVEAADGKKGDEVVRRLNLFRYATYILGALSRGTGGDCRLLYHANLRRSRFRLCDSRARAAQRSRTDRTSRGEPSELLWASALKGSLVDGSKIPLVIDHARGNGNRACRHLACARADSPRQSWKRRESRTRAAISHAPTAETVDELVPSRSRSPAKRRFGIIMAGCGSGP